MVLFRFNLAVQVSEYDMIGCFYTKYQEIGWTEIR